MGPIIAGGIIALTLVLAIDWFVAMEFRRIAEEKGHPGEKYQWWVFFTGIFGCLMVAALPDRKKAGEVQTNTQPEAELPEL